MYILILTNNFIMGVFMYIIHLDLNMQLNVHAFEHFNLMFKQSSLLHILSQCN